MADRDIGVGGTLVWYYHICKRQVWLMSHQLTPDQEDTNVAIGRLIDRNSYGREKKQLAVGSSKMDIFSIVDGQLVIGEVKKSSRYRDSARMQLAFYLKELSDRGIEAGAQGVVYGLSGGLDSALVGALCQRAFPEDSLAVIMPCYSIEQDLEDARLVADVLGLKTKVVVLDQVYDILRGQLDPVSLDIPSKKKQLILANMKPRLRMIVLYYYASIHKYLVVGGSNKSELTVGYFTKHGDGGSDLIPLGNLVKYQVRELARYLGVPDKIITKPPSAGLWKNQNDEDDFGFTYAMLDRYLLDGEISPAVQNRMQTPLRL